MLSTKPLQKYSEKNRLVTQRGFHCKKDYSFKGGFTVKIGYSFKGGSTVKEDVWSFKGGSTVKNLPFFAFSKFRCPDFDHVIQ